jgi:hypothetical protein
MLNRQQCSIRVGIKFDWTERRNSHMFSLSPSGAARLPFIRAG